MVWAEGDVIVLREVLDDRIRSARPLAVLADEDEALVGYLAPRSEVAWPRLVGAEQSQTPDQGWRLARETWRGPGCLFVLPAGESFAVVRFLDADTGEPGGWKVDFLAPPRRHRVGLDTLDWALDLVVSADLSSVTVKDEDDLAQLELVGLLGEGGGERVREARRRAEALVADRAAPFSGRWARWRPPPAGGRGLRLPRGWDRLPRPDPARGRPPAPKCGAEPTPSSSRSPTGSEPGWSGAGWSGPGRAGSGTRLLDERGRTLLDLDLAGGNLLHGHAHPRIVEAITRQVPLGLGPTPVGGLGQLLAGRLAERFATVETVVWAGSGPEAWWAAVRAARRTTGRRRVACWWPAPALGGDDRDDDVVVLPPDLPAAHRVLTGSGERWAALIVDPLVVAGPAEGDRTTQLDGSAWTDRAPGALVVADERRTLGAGPGGGQAHLALRPDLVVLGASLFAGLGGGALAGRADLAQAAVGRVPSRPSTRPAGGPARRAPHRPACANGALHPVLATAGLATLHLATPAALADLAARADRLRARIGGEGPAGLGGAVRLPPGATSDRLAQRGLLVDDSGWAWLATVSTDDDVEEAAAALNQLG